MKVSFKSFSGTLVSWDVLFQQAADFASQIGQARLISISHSCANSHGVVTVWSWE